MDVSLPALFNLYTFSTGRRLFALQQARKAAVEQGFDPLVVHVDAAIERDRGTRSLEFK